MTMTAPLDASALSALAQAARAATPGPWVVDSRSTGSASLYVWAPERAWMVAKLDRHDPTDEPDAAFIAAAFIAAAHPGTVLALIAEVRALRAALLETCEDIARQGGGTAEWWRDRLVVDARKALESGA